jgi:hypothetical protein
MEAQVRHIKKKYEKLRFRLFRSNDNLCLFIKLYFFAAFDCQRCVAFSPSYDMAPPPKLRLIIDPTGYRLTVLRQVDKQYGQQGKSPFPHSTNA